jgi:hypothetical protein
MVRLESELVSLLEARVDAGVTARVGMDNLVNHLRREYARAVTAWMRWNFANVVPGLEARLGGIENYGTAVPLFCICT